MDGAREHLEPDVTLQATLLSGLSRIFLGELQAAQRELEYTIARYDAERHEAYIILFMQDPGVAAHSLIVVPSWILGYPERARQHAEQALALARRLQHPAALVLAYVAMAQIEWFRGDAAQARALAEAGLALSIEQGFDLYRETLSILLGAALCEQGELRAGLARIEQSWSALLRAGTDFSGACWRSLLASTLAREGRAPEAFALLGEAFSRVRSHEERWWEPELYRLLGELLAQHGSDGMLALGRSSAEFARDPESCFGHALELARQSQARSFELRAALSLARVWQARGDSQAARTLLAETYAGFSEGFDTSDLQRARQLLTELGESSLPGA